MNTIELHRPWGDRDIPVDATDEQIIEYLSALANGSDQFKYEIGRVYNEIPPSPGGWTVDERRERICKAAGVSERSAREYAQVVRLFSTGARAPLKFKHLLALAHEDLTKSQRDELMNRAIKEEWSVRLLIAQRDEMLGINPSKLAPAASWEAEMDKKLNGMPKAVSGKAKTVIKGMYRRMASDFGAQVRAEVSKKLYVERKKVRELEHELEEKSETLTVRIHGARAVMSEKEWRSVIQFVHPDKHPDNHKQAEKVFEIMNRFKGSWTVKLR